MRKAGVGRGLVLLVQFLFEHLTHAQKIKLNRYKKYRVKNIYAAHAFPQLSSPLPPAVSPPSRLLRALQLQMCLCVCFCVKIRVWVYVYMCGAVHISPH